MKLTRNLFRCPVLHWVLEAAACGVGAPRPTWCPALALCGEMETWAGWSMPGSVLGHRNKNNDNWGLQGKEMFSFLAGESYCNIKLLTGK